MKESLNKFIKNNNGNPLTHFLLPFFHNSAWKEKLSENAVETVILGKGDEKAKEWGRERERKRETKRDPFDVHCYNTSQSQLKGFVKNAWHAHN